MRLKEAAKILSEAGVDSALHDARAIFRCFGGISEAELLISDPEVSDEKTVSAIYRRAEREPLQYIIGEVDFYRERYEVSKDCLIPRSDTEILVDFAVHSIPEGESFADICTGSGCIAISTLKNTKNTHAVGIDISEGALRMAARNAEKNGVSERLTLIQADAMSYSPSEKVFAILSNPPYVTDGEYEDLEPEIKREPREAFLGGRDGLDFYRAIIPRAVGKIKNGGFVAVEIGAEQAEGLFAIARELDLSGELIKDLGGRDRVFVIRPK